MRPMRLGVFCFALAIAALCLARVTGAAGTASFPDPPGDSGAAPDITAVTVANDDDGLITFTVTIANRSALGPDDAIAIPFATNTPGKAGLRDDGVNFVLGLEGSDVFLQKWTGGIMLEIAASSLRGSFSGGTLTLTVRQDDLVPGYPSLAAPTELAFYVIGLVFDGAAVAAEDDAPDGADQFWSYRLVQPARIVVTYFFTPRTVTAGSRFVAKLGAAWSDTGRTVKPRKVSCRAKLGGRLLKGAAAGYANCSWAVPKGSDGKTIRGSVTLTSGAASITRSFSTRVR